MSTPAVGSSRISSLGSCISARAIIRRRFMPPERRAGDRVAPVPQLQLLQIFLRPLLAPARARNAVKTRLVHDDGVQGLEQVEIDLLRHDADAGLCRFELAIDVVPEHLDHCRWSC